MQIVDEAQLIRPVSAIVGQEDELE